jgi:hypothetical protein
VLLVGLIRVCRRQIMRMVVLMSASVGMFVDVSLMFGRGAAGAIMRMGMRMGRIVIVSGRR